MPETAARVDPLLGFRFRVTFDDMPPAGFSECGGLQVETDVFEYAEGGGNSNVLRFPTRTKHASITLRRGIAGRAYWDWYDDVVDGQIRQRNGTIAILKPDGSGVAAEWQVRDAFPCKWIGPDLAAEQSTVAIETVELCHHGLRRRT
jgi:phage tail-like protein